MSMRTEIYADAANKKKEEWTRELGQVLKGVTVVEGNQIGERVLDRIVKVAGKMSLYQFDD